MKAFDTRMDRKGAKFEINFLKMAPDQALVHLLLPGLVPQLLVDNVEEGQSST